MVTMDTNYDETTMMMEEPQDDVAGNLELSAASTTIDPSVVQSRIRQSASLQKEGSAMEDDDDDQQPVFPKLSAAQASGKKVEYRRVRCPPHRYTPLREHWEQILTPLVEFLKLQVRTPNVRRKKGKHRSVVVGRSAGRSVVIGKQGLHMLLLARLSRRFSQGKKGPNIHRNVHCVVLGIYKPSGKPQWYQERHGTVRMAVV